ncbi:MAG TPA: PDZ domain-containing protein, partial [Vicinamibacterales bacterium]|nr:PDZ domain-containing protein [Vicinamibacterales bacterium]
MTDFTANAAAPLERPWLVWGKSAFALAVVMILFALGVANMATFGRWDEVEDGVYWGFQADAVTALEVAPGSPASAAGIQRGDVLLGINHSPVQTPGDVIEYQHRAHDGTRLAYTLLRLD